MNVNADSHPTMGSIENVAAELTVAAYPVFLRHGATGSWIDLELGLWKVFFTTLERIGHVPCPSSGAWKTYPDAQPALSEYSEPTLECPCTTPAPH